MVTKRAANNAEIFLGLRIKFLRTQHDMSRMNLARKIRHKEQDITKYEAGGFVPLTTLEILAEALADSIPKRLIRKISTLRKFEMKTKIEQFQLQELYDQALPEFPEEEIEY